MAMCTGAYLAGSAGDDQADRLPRARYVVPGVRSKFHLLARRHERTGSAPGWRVRLEDLRQRKDAANMALREGTHLEGHSELHSTLHREDERFLVPLLRQ